MALAHGIRRSFGAVLLRRGTPGRAPTAGATRVQAAGDRHRALRARRDRPVLPVRSVDGMGVRRHLGGPWPERLGARRRLSVLSGLPGRRSSRPRHEAADRRLLYLGRPFLSVVVSGRDSPGFPAVPPGVLLESLG